MYFYGVDFSGEIDTLKNMLSDIAKMVDQSLRRDATGREPETMPDHSSWSLLQVIEGTEGSFSTEGLDEWHNEFIRRVIKDMMRA